MSFNAVVYWDLNLERFKNGYDFNCPIRNNVYNLSID